MLYNWNDMRFVKALITTNWQSILKYTALFLFLGAALYWQLGSLLPGYSQAEQATYAASGFKALMDNPLNAPYLVLVKALSFLHADSLLVTRFVSATGGAATLAIFAWLLYRWHGSRVAIAGTLLLGTSAWFLHVARMGTPDVMLFGVVALLAAGFWLKESKSAVALIVCFILGALLLYVPGMIWFILAGVIWQWKTIDRVFKERLATVGLGGLLLLVLIAPLLFGLVRDMSLFSTWLGLPSSIPNPVDLATNILKVPYHLFVSNAADPVRWLGGAPILDVFSLAMFLLGGALYLKNVRLLRTPLLISLLIIGAAMVALNGQAAYSFILPLFYIVIATGVGYLLDQWLRVFPRNPIARGLGYVCIGIVVTIVCAYHLRHYFIGWPQARATVSQYTIQKP
jgi:hypothetical protein